MKADELVQQYQSGAITARELVEGVWDNAATHKDEYGRWLFFTNNDLYHAFFADSLEELYAKGAAFTIARVKEIRQVEEEIENFTAMFGTYTAMNDWVQRILAREQSVIAELSHGLKKEVLT
jgi:hypothetical protein